jgi:hypothetical protein
MPKGILGVVDKKLDPGREPLLDSQSRVIFTDLD